jgi:hypothetical protein
MSLLVIPEDTANHAIYGALIFLGTACVLAATDTQQHRMAALITVVVAGALKELYDWIVNLRRRSQGLLDSRDVDPGDFLATCAGGFVMYLAGAL